MRARNSTAISDWMRHNVLGLVAVFLALTGTAYATHPGGADTISSGDIINNEVKSVDLANGEVKNDDLGANAVGSGKIADQSVKNADLSIGASSSNTIADGGIQNVDVQNNTLTGAKIDESTLFNDNSLTGGDIDESTLSGVPSANAWNLDGNSGTTAANFLGTTDNQPLNLRVNDARALRLEPALDDFGGQSPNVIGGVADNSVAAGVHSATIAGGGRGEPFDSTTANRVTNHQGTVGGGADNTAGGEAATVGGGLSNTGGGLRATVGGGSGNRATGGFATVGGGGESTAGGFAATVAGGFDNNAAGDFSLAGGQHAQADDSGAFVWAASNPFDFASTAQNQFSVRSTGGARLVSGIDGSGSPTSGLELPANTSGWSTLVNGQPFDVRVNGARGLRIDPASDGTNQSPNVIGGIGDNTVTPGVHSAVIGGGGRGVPGDPATANRVTDHQGVVGGGANNQAGDGGTAGDSTLATVGGGGNNRASGEAATVGGGFFDRAFGSRATVGGGDRNLAIGSGATVGGGAQNLAGDDTGTVADPSYAIVAGGDRNTASGINATVGGGETNGASGDYATVPGGYFSRAQGNYSLAAGRNAHASQDGSFVWADSHPTVFASTAQDQFSVRSTGGARFVSEIDGSGNPTAGVELFPGDGSWSSLSDAASKRAVEPVSGLDVLRKLDSVPISTWSYRSQDESVRHIGPMAQDFFRAFGVGEDRRHIASVDADGVALAAIKGLNRRDKVLNQKLATLRRKLAALREESR